jgi:phospholipid-transporting ATPase
VKDNGIYKVYIKGADSSMIPCLTNHTDHPYLDKANKALDDFSSVGLRTLVFGCRYLTSKQFKQIQEKYTEAIKSVDKNAKLKILASFVETDMVLLGCTAIKDHLQEKVREAITRFIEAKIKVWMITGDKLQTAESIAHSAGIFQPEMEVFTLDQCTKETFPKAVIEMKKKLQRAVHAQKRAILLDVSMNSRLAF